MRHSEARQYFVTIAEIEDKWRALELDMADLVVAQQQVNRTKSDLVELIEKRARLAVAFRRKRRK